METTAASHQAWLDQGREEVVEPALPITDAHHHLWQNFARITPFQPQYTAPELHADIGSDGHDGGHNVVATVYMECHHGYHRDGPSELKPVGETEFVTSCMADYRARYGTPNDPKTTICGGIVAFADLRLGDAVSAVIEAHQLAAPQTLRGIRQMAPWDVDPQIAYRGLDIAAGMLGDAKFRAGFAQLNKYGLSFDAWLFYPQLGDVVALAQAFPDTTIIVNHLGGPLGVGSYANRRDEVFAQWRAAITELARCDNVVIKLGGLQMAATGFGWHTRPRPPTSDELVAATRAYYLAAIDSFGTQRCLFESNFPVDKIACSYRTLWNAYKKICHDFSASERADLLNGNAQRIYRI